MNSSKRPGLIARENRGDPQTTRQWLALLADRNSAERLWQPIYGDVPELWREKAKAVEQLLLTHQREFGADRPVWLLRVPARINLMGVHIEHRGGWVNYLPIHRDTWFAVSPRDDHRLLFQNVDSRYQPFAVELADHPLAWRSTDWLDFLEKVEVERGHWRNYVQGVALYLSHLLREPVRGANATVWGDIPPAAGLSSSSALVVGAGEALLAVNSLDLEADSKPEHYGLAEWYVGTRGGAGDHAAMVLGKRGQILHLQFFPIRYSHVPLPSGYAVVAINSLHSAAKSDGVRHVFNEKIVAYEIGFRLIRKNHPELADRLRHLRDVNAEHLGISQADVYRLLRELPMTISRAEAVARLGDEAKPLERLFKMHPEPMTGYEVRGVCFFGLAECDRGRLAAELLESGRIHEFGRLMYISHDGDRIARRNAEGYRPWQAPVDDAALDALIELSESANPLDREQARLAYQPGGYRCSVLELDEIVDIARRVEGVVGAGLTGAGLGGMVLALTEAEAAPRLLEVLKERYYAPRGLEPAAEVCVPAAGAGFFSAP